MAAWSLFHRLPAHLINGIGVGAGIAVIQGLTAGVGGAGAAVAASTGAVCASLADVPLLMPNRTARRVSTAAVVGLLSVAIVSLLRPHPIVLGLATGLIAFLSSLALAWGQRAGPVSFVAILALVFTMAAPAAHSWAPLGWTALGAALYVMWAVAMAHLLRRRNQSLALIGAIDATAGLLRARAALLVPQVDGDAPLAPPDAEAANVLRLQAWIRVEAVLAERLQVARDMLFTAGDTPRHRRETALLLRAIDLRDRLLASELDWSLLGADSIGMQVRTGLAAHLHDMADELDAMRDALRWSTPLVVTAEGSALLQSMMRGLTMPPGDGREHLVPALLDRARRMRVDIERMRTLLHGGEDEVPIDRRDLQFFVSLEGWPLASLRPHMSLRSPVLRHALRAGLALSAAYFVAHAFPWGAHPHWLVLSVAVVLRGNLEQTLARRNARVGGTLLGCVLVLAASKISSAALVSVVFLVAVGVAHSYVTTRYLVTAIAATVMALLQAHIAHPESGYAVAERMVDTFFGALLAWGASYVLPSWERRGLSRTVARVLRGLDALAEQALRWPSDAKAELAMRLARREVYEALDALSATAQRTSVEPRRVRVSLARLAELLNHSQSLLAHMAAVRLMIAGRGGELDRPDAEEALLGTAAAVHGLLAPASAVASEAALHDGEIAPLNLDEALAIPRLPVARAPMPWLRRRLLLSRVAAQGVAQSSASLLPAAAVPPA